MWHSAYSKAKLFYSQRRTLCLTLLSAVLIAGLALLLIKLNDNQKPQAVYAAVKPMPLSRSVMLVAEEQVRAIKPPPTEAARQYAYISAAYDDGLVADDQSVALHTVQQIMLLMFPTRAAEVNKRIDQLAVSHHIQTDSSVAKSTEIENIVNKYKMRNSADGHDLKWDGIIPKGPGKWVKTTAVNPLTPRAGDWRRWVVSQPVKVSPPPVVGSIEDIKQMRMTAIASASRNGDDVNKINFWGGTPGTDTPSGIWQNQLYKTVYEILPNDVLSADQKYSHLQAVLAQTQSDAFMECWKVKYTYWTGRPDMRDSSIKTAMHDPNFPGYISGHSTISKAAADVLSVMVPRYSKVWLSMAVEARQSRLKAGIHYDIDNEEGFNVGAQVAKQVVTLNSLQAVL
jgi:hypothetical protein